MSETGVVLSQGHVFTFNMGIFGRMRFQKNRKVVLTLQSGCMSLRWSLNLIRGFTVQVHWLIIPINPNQSSLLSSLLTTAIPYVSNDVQVVDNFNSHPLLLVVQCQHVIKNMFVNTKTFLLSLCDCCHHNDKNSPDTSDQISFRIHQEVSINGIMFTVILRVMLSLSYIHFWHAKVCQGHWSQNKPFYVLTD